MTDEIPRTEAEWRNRLTAQQYHVLREKGTERPFTNEYDDHFEPGVYACAACGRSFSLPTRNSIPAVAGLLSTPLRRKTAWS